MKKQAPKKIITGTGIILIVILIGMWLFPMIFINPDGSGSGDFSSYCGPVLPMTSLNGAEGVDVRRNVDFDFSPYQDNLGYSRIGKGAAGITDTYVLTNTTEESKVLELVYGFQGQFIDHPEKFPVITVDDTAISPDIYPSVDVNRLVWDSYNFDRFSQVLTENDFLSVALVQAEELDIPVTAYHITELSYDGEEQLSYPMLTLRFSQDDNTTVWTMIADEYGTEENGKSRMMFRVDRGEIWVFTSGGTLEALEFGGNKGYNISNNSELEGVTFQLETKETTLADAIAELAQDYDYWAVESHQNTPNPGYITPELLIQGAIKRIHALGYLEPSKTVRMISELFYQVVTEPRMMYMVFPVELEPGQSVTVEASYIQEPSQDISGPKEYREGYDLATKLGSDLHFTDLTSSLSNTDPIELGAQNFGFDLENGITNVTLDLQVERYYLEVRIRD